MGDRGTAEDSLKRDSNETKTDHDIIVLNTREVQQNIRSSNNEKITI